MLGLLQGVEKTAEIYFLHIFFAGLLLGGSNVEKWVDHQKKKFFISHSIEALIQFKEENQGPLKLYVPLGKGEEGMFFEAEK